MKVIALGRVEEQKEITQKDTWKLLKQINLTSSINNIMINTDIEGNTFKCKEIIIVGKVVANTTSKPMCKLNGKMEFSGVSSTYVNGTKYIYDTYKVRGFFTERDMKYLNQDVLENSVLFDNGFFKVIKGELDNINSIELYGDSSTFTFRSGTTLEIYGRI